MFAPSAARPRRARAAARRMQCRAAAAWDRPARAVAAAAPTPSGTARPMATSREANRDAWHSPQDWIRAPMKNRPARSFVPLGALALAFCFCVPAAEPCPGADGSGTKTTTTKTRLAAVPALLRIPPKVTRPPILLWHGFGSPASERQLMEALPLDDVPAIKVYLGLPQFGARERPDGRDDMTRRQSEDLGRLVFEPVVVGAAQELPSVVTALQQLGCLRSGDKVSLFGFSAGGAAALIALAEQKVPVN